MGPMGWPGSDQCFIVMISPHHQWAIAFAMRALSRVCHPELTILAQQTSSSPLREMALIRLWVRQCSVTAVSV